MAYIFSGFRPQIAWRMAAGDDDLLRWLQQATFAKASTEHWIAWHPDDPSQAMVLPPDHPADKPGIMIESWEKDSKVEDFFEYVESGEFDRNPPSVLNLFIEERATGKWE